MKKSLLLMFIIICVINISKSQTLDSLENALSKASDTIRINLINKIGMKLIFNGQDIALKYCDSAIRESINLNFGKGQVAATYIKGIVNDIRGVSDSSEYYFKQGYELSRKYNIIEFEANGLNNLGMMNWNLGKLNDALDYFLKALRIYEEIGLENGISKAISNIGLIYQELNQYEKALKYNFESLKIRLQSNNLNHIAKSYNNIGICYRSLQMYDSSLYYYNQGLSYAIKSSSYQEQASIYDNIANVYDELSNHDKSIKYHLKALAININRSPTGLIISHNNLGSLYIEIGNYEKALYHTNKSHTLIQSYNIKGNSLSDMYKNKATTYLKLANSDSAAKYFDMWAIAKDSIYGEKNSKAIAEMQTKYETEKKEKEIDLLTAQTDLQNLQLQNNQYAMIGGGIIAILFIISIIALYSRKNYKLKIKFAQEKESQQKSRFKAVIDAEEKERKRIAQDLHDGLGQLLSTARLNVSVLESEEDESQNTQVNNSLKLIDDAVSEVRNISHNMMPNALVSIGFEAALKEQVHLINDAHKVKVYLTLPENKILLEESKAISLYRVIQEILNNALKYAEADNIWIEISSDENLQISIKDDGKGFDTKLIENSTGIGWENIISRTDLLNGVLDIQSVIGKGSEVFLKLAM